MMNTIITGSNSGMGYETAVSLVKQNHTIILTSRQLSSAQAAKETILQTVPDA
jgi:short-subunit dehydrogenase